MRDKRKYSGGYGGFGRQVVTHVGWWERPSTNGANALKDAPKHPLRPARQYKFEEEMRARAPLPVGTKLHVYINVFKLGIRIVAAGAATVVDVFWVRDHWIVDLEVNGRRLNQWLRLEEVMEGLVNWWKRRARQKRSEGAVSVGRQPAPSPLLLPAPHNPIVALLPERVA